MANGMPESARIAKEKAEKEAKENSEKSKYNINDWNDISSYVAGENPLTWASNISKTQKTYEAIVKNWDDIVNATQKKGSALTKEEIMNYAGLNASDEWYAEGIYNRILNNNYDIILGTGLENYQQDRRTEATAKNVADFQNALKAYGVENQQLAIPEQGQLGLDYQALLDAQNKLTDTQYLAAMESLQRSENDMYRALGMSQRQMERDIAKRRQQALKSGMSTAQLAAQEQQNLLAAQTGATQIAQQYADQRYNTINQFAGAKDQNYINALQSQIGWNQQAQIQNQNANNAWAQAMSNFYAQAYSSDALKEQYKNQS